MVFEDSEGTSCWIFGIGKVISRCFGGEGSAGDTVDLGIALLFSLVLSNILAATDLK